MSSTSPWSISLPTIWSLRNSSRMTQNRKKYSQHWKAFCPAAAVARTCSRVWIVQSMRCRAMVSLLIWRLISSSKKHQLPERSTLLGNLVFEHPAILRRQFFGIFRRDHKVAILDLVRILFLIDIILRRHINGLRDNHHGQCVIENGRLQRINRRGLCRNKQLTLRCPFGNR